MIRRHRVETNKQAHYRIILLKKERKLVRHVDRINEQNETNMRNANTNGYKTVGRAYRWYLCQNQHSHPSYTHNK